ncbi:MAG: hypothetical protein ACR2NL_05765 [Acidimicrobiia bacterium]
MAHRTRKRLGTFGLTAVVVALGTLIVGVALALITIQITGSVASNEFATTTTTVPPTTTTTVPGGDGLRAAISTNGSDRFACQNAINAGSLTLGAESFDLNSSAAQSLSPQTHLCVTNRLEGGFNEIRTLTVQAIVDGSTEDACSDDEKTTDPDGPADCGSVGELGDVVQVVLVPAFLQDVGCRNSPEGVVPGGAPVSLLNGSGALTFDFVCSWEVKLQLLGSATYDEKLAASTDSIALRLDITGSGG